MIKRGRPISTRRAEYEKKLRALAPGASFFVPDATQDGMSRLRKVAKAIGVTIEIHEVEVDEIYQMPGVRVFKKIA